MFVLVVGGGKVGYYLTKELIDGGPRGGAHGEGPRRGRAQIADEIGSIVIAHDGCEGKYLAEAGGNRADIVAAVTGDDEDNLVICQMAKHHFDVPADHRARQQPQERGALPAPRRGRDHQPHADGPAARSSRTSRSTSCSTWRPLGGGELELIEAQLQAGSPAIGRAPATSTMPDGCSLFAVIRDGVATPLRPDTILLEGDKVIAIGKQRLRGPAPRPAHRRRGTGRRRRLRRHGAGAAAQDISKSKPQNS